MRLIRSASGIHRFGCAPRTPQFVVVSSHEPTQAALLRPDSRPPERLFVSIGFRDRVRDGVSEGTEGRRRFGSQKLDKKARGNERHQEPQ
jgi:hypothetical protein